MIDNIIIGLENFDYNLFRLINDMHSPFFDDVMWWMSNKFVWAPLYAFILFLLYRAYGWKGALLGLIGTVACVAVTDITSYHLIKNTVQRYRPSHNTEFGHLVHIVNDYRGGSYGFVSGHAANSFVVAIFAGRLLKHHFPYMLAILVIWALLVSYSRIYLGVHYPGDIVGGAILGGVVGYLMSILWIKVILKKWA